MPSWFSRLIRRRPGAPQTPVTAPPPLWHQARPPTGGGLAPHASPQQVLGLQRQLGNRATTDALMAIPHSSQGEHLNNPEGLHQEDAREMVGANRGQSSDPDEDYVNGRSARGTENAQDSQTSVPPIVQQQHTANSLWALDAFIQARHGLAPLFPAMKQLEIDEFPTTKYLSPLDSQSMTLTFRGGKLMRRVAPGPDQPPGKWQLEPYDTTGNTDTMHGKDSEVGQALYVLTRGGTLLSAPGKIGEMHHSSLVAGTDVAGAGMMRVEQGKIRSITNNSGHYRPSAEYLRNVLQVFQRNHVNLEEVEVEEADGSDCDREHLDGHTQVWPSGKAWLEFHEAPLQDPDPSSAQPVASPDLPPESSGQGSSAPSSPSRTIVYVGSRTIVYVG